MLYQLCQLKETGLFLKKCTVLLYRNTLIISYLTCGLALQWFSESELVPTNQQIKYMKKSQDFTIHITLTFAVLNRSSRHLYELNQLSGKRVDVYSLICPVKMLNETIWNMF